MGHNLEIKNGIASFFAVKEPAWHGLGTIVTEAQTQEQVIKLANLDYEVCLQELYTPYLDGSHSLTTMHGDQMNVTRIKDRYAIMRCDTGKVYGFVKDRYQVIQNTEAFLFFDSFIERTEAIYQSAGVLFDGAVSWILAKLPEHITVHGDNIDMYVMVSMWHDGQHSMQMMFTPVRVVCWNTLLAATRSAHNIVSIRHKSNYKQRIEEAVRLMGIKNNYVAEINEVFLEMANTKVSTRDAEAYFNKLVAGKPEVKGIEISSKKANQIATMLEYYNNHPTQQNIKGTVFGLYNAVTGYWQNVKTYNDDAKRFNNIMVKGDANASSARAFHLANMLI